MQQTISFVLDGQIQTIDFNEHVTPTTTVLNYLRKNPAHKGVKEGCAEGDCGACTVVIGELKNNKMEYQAWDSCLVFLPMLHGKQLITVENLKSTQNSETILHPVQQTMVDCNGSQCGYCTPGIVMSLFALYKNEAVCSKESIEDALTGNLCRCTGYKPIIDAGLKACSRKENDYFTATEKQTIEQLLDIHKNTTSIEIHTNTQNYYKPKTKAEALVLKDKLQNAIVVNGGTDIALRVTKKNELLTNIIDLSGVAELKNATANSQEIIVGAGLSLEEVKKVAKEKLPALYDALTVFGSKQIRSVATLGGNLGSASPIGDTLPVLMAYNADIVLESIEGKRKVNINNFIIGYRQTERKENELITEVIIPVPPKETIVKFYKVSKRKDLDISTASAGFSLVVKNKNVAAITLAYGGMAATTKRASTTEAYLIGKEWNRQNVEEAMLLIEKEYTPISDARSGAEFRSIVSKNLLLKFWNETEVLVGSL
ncbi:MAG: xanthine dehydrogenase small subunit [Bacteroidia bacterium]